ncbi:MAG: PhoH family protein [Bacteroidales bacterium]|jgi:phosphate starvation-inducible PhoH-like protein
MHEKTIVVEDINPLDLYGVNDCNLEFLKKSFPHLKIIARNNIIKIIGNERETTNLVAKVELMFEHYEKFGKITENDIAELLDDNYKISSKSKDDSVLVHGNNGMYIKARSANQQKMVRSYENNDLIFSIGPAGTGKTYTAVALAVRALKNKEVKKIILTRPAVEAGEKLGFLPGDIRDKLDPYLQPLYDALRDMLPPEKLAKYIEDGTIQIAPLAYMRGRTLDNAVAILDEAQNSTEKQIKMFVTRMGKNSKFFVTGDITQIDLPKNEISGLAHAAKILKGIEGIDFIYMNDKDIVRHKLVVKIVDAYKKSE